MLKLVKINLGERNAIKNKLEHRFLFHMIIIIIIIIIISIIIILIEGHILQWIRRIAYTHCLFRPWNNFKIAFIKKTRLKKTTTAI